MNINEFIAARQAAPKQFRVTTEYLDGSVRAFETETAGQAENYAHGQRAKLGRDLISRDNGKTVRVINVTVSAI